MNTHVDLRIETHGFISQYNDGFSINYIDNWIII